ncbi:nucleotidyltransferase domain-containing protein [Geodermatophilus sp. TF02-6]|uniref:nucleotidyltransferase domain-containing protein n=1 Tax=Geodermatophilus sp. TF02-6 TaxID=2250575 RepID=UPI0013143756|nr:nucleotidyltransferase domain-containing protein [Geodermatophilus sp. TF02-6]
MADLDLREERRTEIVDALRAALAGTAPSARVALRGSLAGGTADAFSDIDLRVDVAGADRDTCLQMLPAALGSVRPVRLLRLDPETAAAPDRRLVYALLRGLPVFWRVDLEVVAHPPLPPPGPVPAGPAWSWPASALMNAVAAVRAAARGDEAAAAALLARGADRVTARLPDRPLPARIVALAASCAVRDPALADLAAETAAVTAVLGAPARPWSEPVPLLPPAERRGEQEEQPADDGQPEQALDDGADDGDRQPDDQQQAEEAEHGHPPGGRGHCRLRA